MLSSNQIFPVSKVTLMDVLITENSDFLHLFKFSFESASQDFCFQMNVLNVANDGATLNFSLDEHEY